MQLQSLSVSAGLISVAGFPLPWTPLLLTLGSPAFDQYYYAVQTLAVTDFESWPCSCPSNMLVALVCLLYYSGGPNQSGFCFILLPWSPLTIAALPACFLYLPLWPGCRFSAYSVLPDLVTSRWRPSSSRLSTGLINLHMIGMWRTWQERPVYQLFCGAYGGQLSAPAR